MRRADVVGSWVLIFALLGFALLLGTFGWIHTGWDLPVIQCLNLPVPELGGPFYEATEVDGVRTIFPLGIDCTYDVAGDAYGPQTVHNYNAVPSVLLVLSLVGAVGVWAGLRWRLRIMDSARGSTD